MDTSKIIKGVVGGGRYTTTTSPIVKEDYGLYLKIEGLELPQTYEVDFSNSEHNGTSVTMIGNSDGVLIPNQFISSGKDVFAFLYHVGVDFGRTLYKFRIPNKLRPDRTNEQPTPEEQSTIDQAISALNSAVEQTAEDVASAHGYAQASASNAESASASAQSADASREAADESEYNAQVYAENAQASATASANSATQAQASAQTASQKADSITGLTASAQTLSAGSSASASYDAQTGVMTFGIPKGADGTDGDDGYSPTATVTKVGDTATITITDKNGTTTAQISDGSGGGSATSPTASVAKVGDTATITITDINGTTTASISDGKDGTNGQDGYSPTASVSKTGGTATITMTDKNGTTTATVSDGTNGTDGTTFTPSVSNAGVISWTNDGGKQNPASVDLVSAIPTATTQTDGKMSATDKGRLDTLYADYSSALTALGVI